MVMGLALSGVFQSVQANQKTNNNPGGPTDTPTVTPVYIEGIADGDWSTGTDVSTDLSDIKPPKSYLQQLGDAVQVTEKGKICHPFRGGEYGWHGSIYQLIHGKWTKGTTYFTWYPDSEGAFMACTYAAPGGIYALFGAYDGMINPTATQPPTATPTRTPTPKPTSKPPQAEPTRINRQ
jgi:hypothetical protein